MTPKQFDELVARIPEPYASMIYVAVYTGLRVSELAGLKWNDVITIEQVNEKGELENSRRFSPIRSSSVEMVSAVSGRPPGTAPIQG